MALWLQALKLLQLSKNGRKGQVFWPQPLRDGQIVQGCRSNVQWLQTLKPLNFEH
jgi:hypothetical protein